MGLSERGYSDFGVSLFFYPSRFEKGKIKAKTKVNFKKY